MDLIIEYTYSFDEIINLKKKKSGEMTTSSNLNDSKPEQPTISSTVKYRNQRAHTISNDNLQYSSIMALKKMSETYKNKFIEDNRDRLYSV